MFYVGVGIINGSCRLEAANRKGMDG